MAILCLAWRYGNKRSRAGRNSDCKSVNSSLTGFGSTVAQYANLRGDLKPDLKPRQTFTWTCSKPRQSPPGASP